jgi:5-dehydro-4-deoxyglucarate dehydratase
VTEYSPTDLAAQLKSGLLSFPVTHFTDDLQLDEAGYRKHLSWLAEYPVAGLFAAGGTGEGFSLTFEETDRVVRAAVDEVAGTVPVLAPATGSTANAVAQAKAAEAAGADGLLLMPPYLTESSQAGLADRNPTMIGFKDGVGSIEQMTRTYARVGDRLMYVGGLPTAETFALPLLQLGVSTYSSALFNFVPQWAIEFYDAVRAQDRDEVYRRLSEFVLPYLDIRDRTPGYAVSIVKGGLAAIGRPAGPVRPPLTDLRDSEVAELRDLIARIS